MRLIASILAASTLLLANPNLAQIGPGPDLNLALDDGLIEANAGQLLTYLVSVANLGNTDATGVVVRVTVPEHTTFDTSSDSGWTCFGPGAGSQCTLNLGTLAQGSPPLDILFAARIDDAPPESATEILATASISDDGSNGPDQNPADNTDTDQTSLAPVTELDLALTKDDGNVTAQAGAPLIYELTVSNLGSQNATGVVLREVVPDHTNFHPSQSDSSWFCTGTNAGSVCTLNIGDLPSGAPSAIFAFAVEVDTTLPAGVTEITNTAEVLDDGTGGPDIDQTDNIASVTTPLGDTTGPDLILAKSDGGLIATPGEVILYTLTAANIGNQDETGAQLTEVVPSHTTFLASESDPRWVCLATQAGSTCRLNLGSLPITGQPETVLFAVLVDSTVPPGTVDIFNESTILASGNDLDPANNASTTVTPLDTSTTGPDLVLAKSDGSTIALPGEPIGYTLTLENVGNQDATGVVISETIPENTVFSDLSDARWLCNGTTAGSTCSLGLGGVAATSPPQSIDFVVIVEAALPPGTSEIINTASVSDDGASGPDLNPGDNSDTLATPLDTSLTGPDLVLTKDDGGIIAQPGDPIVYTLTVENVGNQDATGVTVSETIPDNTTFLASSSHPAWICIGTTPGATCLLTLGDVEAGGALQSAAFAVSVRTSVPPGNSEITNTAFVTDDGSNGADLDPSDNVTSAITPLRVGPDLSILKFDGGITAFPASTIIYTLDVTYDATPPDDEDLIFTETVPEFTTFSPDPSDASWFCTGTAPGATCTLNAGPGPLASPLSFAVIVDAVVPPGVSVITNTASVSTATDPNPSNNSITIATPLPGPDLSLSLEDGGITAVLGGLITYTLDVVSFTGTYDAADWVFTQTVPEHTTYSASDSDPWICDGSSPGSTCTFNAGPGPLPAPLRFAVVVDTEVPDGVFEINHSASVIVATDPDPSNNTASRSTPLTVPVELQSFSID